MSDDVSYALPVAGLLIIGDPNNKGVEGQIAALGLGQEHVPELVRMAVDPELNSAAGDSLEVWAPPHALRTLKGLDVSAHAAELMPLIELHEDDWFREELPGVFAQIGRPALASLQVYLADRSHSEWGHSLVARSRRDRPGAPRAARRGGGPAQRCIASRRAIRRADLLFHDGRAGGS